MGAAHTGLVPGIIRQQSWPKRPNLDGPEYALAQNKMANVHVHRKNY